jgi:hypothetical protein
MNKLIKRKLKYIREVFIANALNETPPSDFESDDCEE